MSAIETEGLVFRRATRKDVVKIVSLLADDLLGQEREQPEDPLPESYFQAFEAIDADPNQELVVGDYDGMVVASLQLTFLPYLTHRGSWRAQIEAVRVHSSHRGSGTGKQMVRWAVDRAQQRGCHLVQLTTDKRRPDAVRFYESLGFEPTHEGMKLYVEPRDE